MDEDRTAPGRTAPSAFAWEPGALIEVGVGAPAHGGHCVARVEGRVLFVRHTLPGERVIVRLTEPGPRGRWWRADAVDVLEASADRVPSRWPAAGPGGVGGGELAHVSIAGQHTWKRDVIVEQLRRLAHLHPGEDCPEVVVESVAGGGADGLAYRTRIGAVADADGRAGMHRYRSHDIVPLRPEDPGGPMPLATAAVLDLGLFETRWTPGTALEAVAPADGGPALLLADGRVVRRHGTRATRPAPTGSSTPAPDAASGPTSGPGAPRGEDVRADAQGARPDPRDGGADAQEDRDRRAGAVGSVRILGPSASDGRTPVGGSTPGSTSAGAADGGNRARGAASTGAAGGRSRSGGTSPDAGGRNPGRGPSSTEAAHGGSPVGRTSATLASDRGPGTAGSAQARPTVTERVTVGDRTKQFRVGAASFWQVHVAAPAVLTAGVLAAVGDIEGGLAWDLYSGSGLFAAFLADAVGPGGRVLAVESDAEAVRDARRSLYATRQVDLVTARVTPQLVGQLGSDGRPDVVVLDPPRAGAGLDVMRALTATGVGRIVYVACDPVALARDLALASEAGYRLTTLRTWDLFPHTHHVECLAVLER